MLPREQRRPKWSLAEAHRRVPVPADERGDQGEGEGKNSEEDGEMKEFQAWGAPRATPCNRKAVDEQKRQRGEGCCSCGTFEVAMHLTHSVSHC